MNRRHACRLAVLVLCLPSAVAFGQVDNSAAQDLTIARIRSLGTAMMAWLTDEAQASDPSASVIDVDDYCPTNRRRLEQMLVPRYIDQIPIEDGWGNALEIYLASNPELLNVDAIMLIRAPGSDGRFDGNTYQRGGFDNFDYTRDIVWADGFFVRAPARLFHPAETTPHAHRSIAQVAGSPRSAACRPLVMLAACAPHSTSTTSC